MLTLQRPIEILQDGSRLVGFLMNYDAAYIFHLKVGYWTDQTIVPNSSTAYYSVLKLFSELLKIFKFVLSVVQYTVQIH